MAAIPANLARVPTLLSSQLLLASITRTNREMLDLQAQLASGKAVNRPSDDAIASSAITVLDDSIERRDQRLRNLSHGEAVLNTVDAALGEATSLIIEARSIGLGQIGIGGDAATRENQAQVIDAMLQEMIALGNRSFLDVQLFGGSATAGTPMRELLGGVQYTGQGDGLVTDLGLSRSLAINASAEDAFGALSTRVQGDRDLDPAMTATTRLVDLDGAGGLGVRLSSIDVDVDGTPLVVDLGDAQTVQNVIDTLQAAIQTVDAGATVSLDPAGNAFRIDPVAGPITIADISGEAAAADLGLTGTFSPPGGAGGDVNPRLTEITQLSSLSGLTLPLGTIRLGNAGQTRDLDLSSAQTVQDVMNLVHGLDVGIRVEIAADGDRLDFVNELSGGAMSVAEVGGGLTATELGVRSLNASTRLSDFNDGLGVEIRSGSVDPVSGLPDPAADLDFRVTLKDGRTFDVDLAGAETVQDVLDLANAAAATAGVTVPAEFSAGLAADGNGLAFSDATVGTSTSVTALNGSAAAEQLGLIGSTTGAILTGTDRATVAVDSVFTHMIALRDALRADDERGISLATDRLEADVARLAGARADVGVRARRVTNAVTREEDLRLQETALRSQVQDLDFTDAAIRFATLQQQLQAGLTTAGRASSLSLLDFLR